MVYDRHSVKLSFSVRGTWIMGCPSAKAIRRLLGASWDESGNISTCDTRSMQVGSVNLYHQEGFCLICVKMLRSWVIKGKTIYIPMKMSYNVLQ